MNEPDVVLTVVVTAEIADLLDVIADELDASASFVITALLDRALEDQSIVESLYE